MAMSPFETMRIASNTYPVSSPPVLGFISNCKMPATSATAKTKISHWNECCANHWFTLSYNIGFDFLGRMDFRFTIAE